MHYRLIRERKMTVKEFFLRSPSFDTIEAVDRFASMWTVSDVPKGSEIAGQGDDDAREVILLSGCAATVIIDAEGRIVCVGLFVGPCVLTPHIARTRDRKSLVSIAVISDASIAAMDTDLLTEKMIAIEAIRDWANAALAEELVRKVDREWCLAALGGAERLAWFRLHYPKYEDIFVHTLIASFLGITPVTLSRLRRQMPAERGI